MRRQNLVPKLIHDTNFKYDTTRARTGTRTRAREIPAPKSVSGNQITEG